MAEGVIKPKVIREGAKEAASRYVYVRRMLDDDPNNSGWMNVRADQTKSAQGLTYVDLFAGGGGLSLGFRQAGFTKLFDNEIDPDAAATLQKNWPYAQHHAGDIAELGPSLMDKLCGNKTVDIVCGGPPCQGFSVAGLRNPHDPRNQLFKEYIRVVSHLQPKFIVLENVPGILTMQSGKVYREIIKQFRDIGYAVNVRILEAAEYGVPQLRSRAIFIGNRLGLKNPYPLPTHTRAQYRAIESALDDLKDLPADATINHQWTRHSAKMEQRIALVPAGGSLYPTFRDAYKRQHRGVPSMTVKENHGGTHIHYEKHRVLSARELARLQCFPDDYIFSGTMKRAYWQIGNAVPVELAKHIALALVPSLQPALPASKSAKLSLALR